MDVSSRSVFTPNGSWDNAQGTPAQRGTGDEQAIGVVIKIDSQMPRCCQDCSEGFQSLGPGALQSQPELMAQTPASYFG